LEKASSPDQLRNRGERDAMSFVDKGRGVGGKNIRDKANNLKGKTKKVINSCNGEDRGKKGKT